MAARDVRADDLALAIGVSRNQTFAKLRGASTWKASEVEEIARYFGVAIGSLYEGMGLLGDTTKPRRMSDGASRGGAPSGIRTPDPLIKSQLL